MTPKEARYHVFVNGVEKRVTDDPDSAEDWAELSREKGRAEVHVIKTIPHQVILVDHIPSCNFCQSLGEYDFKTVHGPWANGCEAHWQAYRAYPKLGTGFGQKWVQRPKKLTGGVHQ
jgi:hypothetical protein